MKNKFNVIIPDRITNADIERSIFKNNAEIKTYNAKEVKEIPLSDWQSADAILLWHDVSLNASSIQKLKNCKVIVRVGVGYDNVDIIAAGKFGIPVCNVPDYGTNEVADHSIALLLSLYRSILPYYKSIQAGKWDWDIPQKPRRVFGDILGIIGLGRIGTATALRAKSLGMKITFYDPYKEEGIDKVLQIERSYELEDLIEKSDTISLHTPLTDETKNMVNETFFTHMKVGSYLINTARGEIVNFDALENALRKNRVSGVALDVLPVEPPDINHTLIQDWYNEESWLDGRLIITPHSAFYNEDSFIEMRRKAASEALRVLLNRSPLNCINIEYLGN